MHSGEAIARELAVATAIAIAIAGACAAEPPAQPSIDAASVDAPPGCPDGALYGPGRHRLFVQGHQGVPRADGRYPLLHQHPATGGVNLCDDRVFIEDLGADGVWQPGEEPRPLGPDGLVHGEHFLVGAGAFTELAIDLCADLGGDAVLYIPNFDQAGSRALHQLVIERTGEAEQEIGRAIDDEAGQSGYNPFVRVLVGVDPEARAGDRLVLRSTNLSGVAFSVMVWQPPSEYESWIVVEVR